jgi:hypothetical protein
MRDYLVLACVLLGLLFLLQQGCGARWGAAWDRFKEAREERRQRWEAWRDGKRATPAPLPDEDERRRWRRPPNLKE